MGGNRTTPTQHAMHFFKTCLKLGQKPNRIATVWVQHCHASAIQRSEWELICSLTGIFCIVHFLYSKLPLPVHQEYFFRYNTYQPCITPTWIGFSDTTGLGTYQWINGSTVGNSSYWYPWNNHCNLAVPNCGITYGWSSSGGSIGTLGCATNLTFGCQIRLCKTIVFTHS